MIVKGWFWMDFGGFLMMRHDFWSKPAQFLGLSLLKPLYPGYMPSILVGHIPFCVPNFDPNPNTLTRLITQNHKGPHDAWWICWYMISGSLAQKKIRISCRSQRKSTLQRACWSWNCRKSPCGKGLRRHNNKGWIGLPDPLPSVGPSVPATISWGVFPSQEVNSKRSNQRFNGIHQSSSIDS